MVEAVWLWLGFAAFVGVLLAFDLGLFSNKSRIISGREALVRVGVYAALAMVFFVGVIGLQGTDKGLQFLTRYLIEYSPSIDNI